MLEPLTLRSASSAIARFITYGACVGVACGVACAVFLAALEGATQFRVDNEWVVYALPLGGLCIGWLYERVGRSVIAGNNLIIDTIHDAGPEIPLRMAPMVLAGTVLTHLFGGSAGREGSAVQMGASMSDWLAHRLRVTPATRRQLLAAGVAGGFGAVFGTPIAGAVFGLEFVVLGHIEYAALLPALIASLVGDMTTRALGIAHGHYPILAPTALTPLLLLKWLVFAACVSAVSSTFIELTHFLKRRSTALVPRLSLRMALGGVVVVGLWKLTGTSDHLGLSLPLIDRSFSGPAVPWHAFALKLLFTAITLGAGFVGGEVTPLFVIGATLGCTLSEVLDIPRELAAGVGLAAMFAAASNTPLALSIMALELLGRQAFPHVVIVSVAAYTLSGARSIYTAQRLRAHKLGGPLPRPLPLRELEHPGGHAQQPPNDSKA